MTPKREQRLRTVLMVCTLVLLVVNLTMTIRLAVGVRVSKRPSLPCGAIPTRFVMEEPECAEKLLRSMNVTNVRIVSPGFLDVGRLQSTTGESADLSE